MLALQSTPFHLCEQDKQERRFDQSLLFPAYAASHQHQHSLPVSSSASTAVSSPRLSHHGLGLGHHTHQTQRTRSHHPRHHSFHFSSSSSTTTSTTLTVAAAAAAAAAAAVSSSSLASSLLLSPTLKSLMPHSPHQQQYYPLHAHQTLLFRETDLKQDLFSSACKTTTTLNSSIGGPAFAQGSGSLVSVHPFALDPVQVQIPTPLPMTLHAPVQTSPAPIAMTATAATLLQPQRHQLVSNVQIGHVEDPPLALSTTLLAKSVQTPVSKIETRIAQMTIDDYHKEKIVLLLTGSFCPIHLQHTEMLEAAKQRMEQGDWENGSEGGSTSAIILGGYLSPSHDLYVGEKLKGEEMVLNSQERLELCRLQTADSDWIDVDAWESTQDQFFDYHKVTSRLQQHLQERCQSMLEQKMEVLRAVQGGGKGLQMQMQAQTQEALDSAVPQRSGSLESTNPFNIRVVYLCGADFVLRTGARKLTNGIVIVDRPLGPPSSNRRSILLTNTGGSIMVPVSNQVEESDEEELLGTSISSTASSSTTSLSLTPSATAAAEALAEATAAALSVFQNPRPLILTAKQRVFKRLEQSYGHEWCEASRNNIWWLPARSQTESEDISSTRIRNLLSTQQSCEGLLHPRVAGRLQEHRRNRGLDVCWQ